MREYSLATLLGALSLVSQVSCTAVAGGDTVVPILAGWKPVYGFHASAADNVAVALTTTPPPTSMKVQQFDGSSGQVTYSDIPGRVYYLEYSPSAEYLLVYHADQEPKVTLVEESGTIVWTKMDSRCFDFSSTGESIVAWACGDEERSEFAEVFDLSGTTQRLVEGGSYLSTVVLFGTGNKIVLAYGHSVVATDYSSGQPVESWRIDLDQNEPLVSENSFPYTANRFVLTQRFGYFKVIQDDGSVLYSFSPNLVDAEGMHLPGDNPSDFRLYKPFALNPGSNLFLYNNSNEGRVLDVSTGDFSVKRINDSPPPGYTKGRGVDGHRLVFISNEDLRIRAL